MEFPADRFGKIKMLLQSCAVGCLLWRESYEWSESWFRVWTVAGHVLVWGTLISTVGSGVSYILKSRQLFIEADD